MVFEYLSSARNCIVLQFCARSGIRASFWDFLKLGKYRLHQKMFYNSYTQEESANLYFASFTHYGCVIVALCLGSG